MDSVQAQFQIRNNALEAQEYAQDLLDWQKSMKAKTSSTKQQHPRLPVRGRAAAAPAAFSQSQPQSTHSQAQATHPAAHTYKNYSKWDRFDVDAALEAAEAQQASSTAARPAQGSSAPVRAPMQQQQQQQEPMVEPVQPNAPVESSTTQDPAAKAAALKDNGNKLFQAKYYEDAISCYTQSIDTHPTTVAYANRAMAYLRLNKHAEAEADCSAALQLDPAYVKAWHRRATARRQLGKVLEAAADFEEVLRLEPSNTAAQADRDQVLDQHLKQQQVQRSSVWHRIPVKLQQEEQQVEVQQQQREQREPQAAMEQPSAQQAVKVQEQQLQPQGLLANGGVARPVTPVNSTSKGSSPRTSPQQLQAVAAAAQVAAQQVAARLASNLKAPKTVHEFEVAWRSLKSDVQLQGKYLALLQPSQLPTLFKSSLTAQLLSTLLTAALTAVAQPAATADDSTAAQTPPQLQPAHAVGLVEGLVGVPRFDMMAMSLGSRDKAGLKQLWDAAAGAAAGDSELQQRLAAVRPKYRL